jgi:nicotinate-nucleotide adenylyltransferase
MIANGREQRIGVLGGTFDPVHYGHLHVANVVRNALELDRIIWIPAGRPPHKRGQIVSSDRDRLAMLELALAGSPSDEISTVDIERSGPSYTADTLEMLRDTMGPAQLYFLMGEDSLRDLPTWHDPERIVNAAELAVVGRPGVLADLATVAESIPQVLKRAHIIPSIELEVSSSDIRRRVRDGESIQGLVPPPVANYIATHNLYRLKPSGSSTAFPLSHRDGRGG